MKVFFRCVLLALVLLLSPSPVLSAPGPALIEKSLSFEEIAQLARETLPQEGVLIRKSDGYVYVKVDDRYIHDLFPLLGVEGSGFVKAPYFRSRQAPGAHISVFYKDEHVDPDEIGKVFHFTVKNVAIVENRQARYIVLQVESKELENLRIRYGLRPLLHGHAYHITIAKQNIR
ncbi:hypothetical protein [Estrella lausannensis]|uniref:Conserved putative secreted protein n=1 Tax=Estrella lausannensis TaxID=483423 RepID=A0A0H5DPS1_9BACT|nr:hypothetical protein [Estrella lausannensis]CRX37499.1 Conserved putative secreted protein [Estrella lausannensis]